MADTVKIQSIPTIGELETWINNDEPIWGAIHSLKVVKTTTEKWTVGEFSYPKPAVKSLKVRLSIGGAAPPVPEGYKHVLDGEALILETVTKVSLFRRT